MNKQATLDQIREAAYAEEVEKLAGEGSEVAGTLAGIGAFGGAGMLKALKGGTGKMRGLKGILPGLGILGLAAAPYALGRHLGARSEDDMKRQNKAGITNLLAPVGAYRLGRRMATKATGYDKDGIPTRKEKK